MRKTGFPHGNFPQLAVVVAWDLGSHSDKHSDSSALCSRHPPQLTPGFHGNTQPDLKQVAPHIYLLVTKPSQ